MVQGDTLLSIKCIRCEEGFKPNEDMLNQNGVYYHNSCFVCEQCFRPFCGELDSDVYELQEGTTTRYFCEKDYKLLYAPQCARCGEFVFGEVIKALNRDWHDTCFTCETPNCHNNLQTEGFIEFNSRLLCMLCYHKELSNKQNLDICQTCLKVIQGKPLRFRGDPYHPYHFNCSQCKCDLDHTARDVGGKLYCLPCHDKMGIPICATCRRPIEGRCVNALGKQYHPEHFVCVTCERPFANSKYFLGPNNLPYCETHYNQLYGDVCIVCSEIILDEVITALEKTYCERHFECQACQSRLNLKKKFVELDMKPICVKCFDKFPGELKKRIKKNNAKKY